MVHCSAEVIHSNTTLHLMQWSDRQTSSLKSNSVMRLATATVETSSDYC
jgi:hypothetical protein